MNTPSRRDLFKTGASLAALGVLGQFSGPGLAAMGPDDKFDLLIRNANALDAGSGLSGKRDIGIRYGLIESIEPTIAPERAQRVMDAGGKLVTPGLIDWSWTCPDLTDTLSLSQEGVKDAKRVQPQAAVSGAISTANDRAGSVWA